MLFLKLQCVKFSLLDVSRNEFCFLTPLNVSIILAAIGQTYLFRVQKQINLDSAVATTVWTKVGPAK